MTQLRNRMVEDMQVRNFSINTQKSYTYQIAQYARYFKRSPDELSPEDIRTYQVYLTKEKKLTPQSVSIAVSALRFLYTTTLRRDWSIEEIIPAPKCPQTLPVVLSPEEVLTFFGHIGNLKHKTVLMTCYAAGLRISEAVSLKPTHIDSQRMVIRVEQGKNQKDRYIMLSERLLEILRHWWRVAKPKQWLFPGKIPGHHITRFAVGESCREAQKRSGFSKPVTPHLLRHYVSRLTTSGRTRVPSDFLGNWVLPTIESVSIARHSFPASQVL